MPLNFHDSISGLLKFSSLSNHVLPLILKSFGGFHSNFMTVLHEDDEWTEFLESLPC